LDATIIFPHQLFSTSDALKKSRKTFIIRDPLFFIDKKYPVRFHKNKILLHLLSTDSYKSELIDRGYDVQLVTEKELIGDNYFDSFFKKNNINEVHYCDPVDYTITKRLDHSIKSLSIKSYKYDTPAFMLQESDVFDHFTNKKSHFMAAFYKKQRKRYNILLNDDGTPVGGKWSFDHENRKRFPKTMEPPKISQIIYQNDKLAEAKNLINSSYNDNLGMMDNFNYPVTRSQALSSFHSFLEERLINFGAYEDAIVKNESTLFHSIITPYLNIGLITPNDIIRQVLDFSSDNAIPLNSLEGFIRQIIGWREFMRGIYIADGVKQRNSNFWNYDKSMPKSFYDATTGIEPLDDTIKKCLNSGYAHHIERLMILGNMMLLLGIKPNSIYKWFMEMFIDSYDWVMVPNVYGMSQFSDGGLLATKPYISGSNYILKMSDYKKGDWCLIWDSLYWSFVNRNRDFFRKNPRMNMMVAMYDKKDIDTKKKLRVAAEDFTKNLF
jgi:deoxyribodipyrimidine photolyase-related protein